MFAFGERFHLNANVLKRSELFTYIEKNIINLTYNHIINLTYK